MEERVGWKAVLSLVFGVLAFGPCPCLGGLLAILFGWGERSGVGRAGFVLGCISVLFGVLLVAVWLLFLLFALIVSIAQH